MLQVALGGHRTPNDLNILTNAPNVYYEPGLTILFPLDISVASAKRVYILVRIRSDGTGDNFEAGTAEPVDRFTLSAINGTTGDSLNASIALNSINSGWNEATFDPYVLTIPVQKTISGDGFQVGVIDVSIRDSDTNSFITFRVLIADSSQPFSYLTALNDRGEIRSTSSTLSTSSVLELSRHGSYTLLSPLTSFQEGAGDDFSYPPGAIFYKREEAVNDESFTFTIDSFDPAVVEDHVNIMPVPQYHKVAVLRIEGMLDADLAGLKQAGSVTIKAVGKITGSEYLFTLNLVPTTSRMVVRSV
jgi:hypothetical protein